MTPEEKTYQALLSFIDKLKDIRNEMLAVTLNQTLGIPFNLDAIKNTKIRVDYEIEVFKEKIK